MGVECKILNYKLVFILSKLFYQIMVHRPEHSRARNDSVVLCSLQPNMGVECKILNYKLVFILSKLFY